MARQKVEKINCDPCNRMELLPVGPEKIGPDFEAGFLGERMVFEDLCSRCRAALKTLWEAMTHFDREIKYTIIKNSGPDSPTDAVPLAPAPNYSPPQPHSAAAAKR